MALLFRPTTTSTISLITRGPTTLSSPISTKSIKLAYPKFSFTSSSLSSSEEEEKKKSMKERKLPILLFDIMDTVVRDPFYQDIPAFFRMPFKELIESKHPTAWIDFEKGLIDEMELARIFFKDGRPFDLEGLKDCMRNGYSYIDGIEPLLQNLKQNNYEIHAFTNYPTWYTLIEDKLKISNYMSWTFCSCYLGKRKPEADSYLEVLKHLGVEPDRCIFIDDRLRNIEAAQKAGIIGIHFKDASSLERELSQLGVETTCSNCSTEANN